MAKYRVRDALFSLISLIGVLGAMLLVSGAAESAATDLPATTATETPPTIATCVHKPAQPFGLVKTSLRATEDGLAVTWRTNTSIRTRGFMLARFHLWADGMVVLVIQATDKAGEKVFRLGGRYLDGEQIDYFVLDVNDRFRVHVDAQAKFVGNEVRAVFPHFEVDQLGEPFRWHAALNVNGVDIDFCPDRVGNAVLPEPLTFPPGSSAATTDAVPHAP